LTICLVLIMCLRYTSCVLFSESAAIVNGVDNFVMTLNPAGDNRVFSRVGTRMPNAGMPNALTGMSESLLEAVIEA